jgi:O-methyltransferase
MAMALALQVRFRNLWMYDTYSGMTDATDSDKDYFGSPASALLTQAKATEDQKESQMIAYASLADVKANLATVNYPINRIKFVMGPVERTIPHEIPECIALLRLDTDFYESTLHELVHLYPRLSPGGLLIIDDYGHWQGAKKAVDEYFGNAGPFLHRIDYTGRLAVKPV